MLSNTILLTISLLLATASAKCPSYWWPMSSVNKNINFFTEVINGSNAYAFVGNTVTGVTFESNDRIGTSSYKAIKFTANNLQLAADTYFCTGSFTISAWLYIPFHSKLLYKFLTQEI
jgi:hypothetical protein